MTRLTVLLLIFVTLFARAAGAQAPSASASASRPTPPNPHGQANPHAGNPHAQANPHGQRTPDSNAPAPDLPAGTLDVTIVDESDKPLPGVEVRLGILSQKISEGEQRSEKKAKTDAEGRVRFTELGTTSDKSYRVTVRSGEAEYGSAPFNLRDNAGQRVLLHVYPSTSDSSKVVVFGAFVSIEPRDDVFQCDVILHVFNMSRMGFVPKDVFVRLPEGFKAFSAGESMDDKRFEAVEGVGATLRGTFPPGEHRAQFRFQLAKAAEREVSFAIRLPDRVAQAQVVAAANPEMNLEVGEGFPPAEVRQSQGGDRVLSSVKLVKRGDPSFITTIPITLTGLRVPSAGRWVAVGIAFVFAALGGLAARGDLHVASAERVQSDRVRARELILRELLLVEHAKNAGKLGPNAYERAHRALVDALARIGVPDEKKPERKRKTAKA
ncbi:MAG TPA: carboxypeptidase-like regulatory domain-containing protein [Polyangiaceae bacterium]